jgi:hypothetical protein
MCQAFGQRSFRAIIKLILKKSGDTHHYYMYRGMSPEKKNLVIHTITITIVANTYLKKRGHTSVCKHDMAE